jgi:hypothetical protein
MASQKTKKRNNRDIDNLVTDDDIDFDEKESGSSDKKFLNNFARNFSKDSEALVRQYMEYFFSDKSLHCGGCIPKSILLNNRRISMVLNYDVCKAADRVYKYTSSNKDLDDADIELFLRALKNLQESLVPKQFIGGMICLYVEFIEGVYLGTEP